MPKSHRKTIDLIVGRGLLSAEAVAEELRTRLAYRLTKEGRFLSQVELLALARRVLDEFEPLLAQNMMDTEIAGWVSGVQSVATRLPAEVIDLGIGGDGGFFTGPPADPFAVMYPDDEPFVSFPLIEKAAQSLSEKRIVTREQFDLLAADVKEQAFTVARVDSEATIEKIRDALADNVREGPSLKAFRTAIEETLETSPIGSGHLETVYRTNVQAAFHRGHDDLASNPIVEEIFPYQEYLAIHDARARHQHRELETLGLSGTNVYRRDDPFWNYFTPPWSFNCRCGINLLTIEAAARKGVAEAREWLRTGYPPIIPEWRIESIPFRPAANWSIRRRLVA